MISLNVQAPKDLRDEFAMAALAGMLSNKDRVGHFAKFESAAIESYRWADAMLAARNKEAPIANT